MKGFFGTEEDALRIASPYLEELCRSNWRYLEYEDRLSELQYCFVCVWRQLPVGNGHFLEDFEAVCRPYMDALDRAASARAWGERSLDGGLADDADDGEELSFHHFLAADTDESAVWVQSFLRELAPSDRALLDALLAGEPRAAIARRNGMTTYGLGRRLKQIGEDYLRRYGN